MARDRDELLSLVMDEMRPLCKDSPRWDGWPGMYLLAQAALNRLEREGVSLAEPPPWAPSPPPMPPEPAPTGDTADVVRKRMAALIANDAYAATFQSLGQYRTALLRSLVAD